MSKNASENKPSKIPYWFPYTEKIRLKGGTLFVDYKGGSCEAELDEIHSIMFYGSVCNLSEDFLDACAKEGIPVCIHRRNMHRTIWITPGYPYQSKDMLTKQILFRENDKKKTHIARKLLKAKFKSMEWLIDAPHFPKRWLSIKELRVMESKHAKKYWERYYAGLGLPESSRRSRDNNLSPALDAISKFVSSILLRWIHYHRFSPFHGYLHEPTDYPSLAYDLIEPYRGYIEQEIFNALKDRKEDIKTSNVTGLCIYVLKEMLYEKIYTHQTRQIVTFHELLHGSVLALRAYLTKQAKRFIVPIPGKPKGGRPKKTGYRLYGRSAGPTNFWKTADKVAESCDYV